jgi:NodT family efflux transporter outer membrane factor (OMF) lipoprotein
MNIRIVATAFAMLASGCTVGPNFTPPSAPTVTRYTSPDEKTVPLGAKITHDWWTLFRSPDLDQLVRQAIVGNHTLEAAIARLAAAREAVTEARSALYPQVNFNASAEREKVATTAFGLGSNAFHLPPNFNLFQIGPNVSYALDIFGGTRRGIEQQAALADYQRDQLAAAYLTLTGDTVTQAIEVAAIRAEKKAAEDVIEIDRQNVDLVRKELQAGTVPDSDVITAESQLAADQTALPPLDQQLSVTRHALAVLLGRPPGEWAPPNFDLAALTLPAQPPVSLPSELIHRRPDIQAAEAQLHAASAQIGVATARLYPAVTLSAGVSATALDPGHLFDPSGLVWSIASGLTQPIFDGGLRQAERRAALESFKASAADYQQTVLRAFEQVADVLQALAHDADLLSAQKRALDMASEAVRLQQINYAKGGAGIINLLDTQRLYQQARQGYVRADAQRYVDTIQLLVAMGGGWWDADPTVEEARLLRDQSKVK